MSRLYKRYGYYVNRCKDELDRVLDTRIDTMYAHFNSIAEDYAKSSTDVRVFTIPRR